MSRFTKVSLAATSLLFVFPSHALAVELAGGAVVPTLRVGISLLGLVVAAVLLIEAGRVRTVAWGGAIAEKISHVVLAILCLAASSIARWTQNFVGGVTFQQVQIASEVLVIVAMVLLGIYFASVRRALHGFLSSMTGAEALSEESSQQIAVEGDATGA